MRPSTLHSRLKIIVVTSLVASLAACGNKDDAQDAALPTLGGQTPLIISHRGLPGLYPEETSIAYEKAADAGGDSLETDLHLTKDCVLVARHNPWLSDNTNIADVAKTNPVVAARKRTVPGVLVNVTYPAIPANGPAQYLSDLTDPKDPKSVLKSLIVDGEDHTNDWSITDFTMAELTQWIGGTTYDARDQRPADLNGKYPPISFQNLIDIAKAKSQALGRTISVYPESKNPYWNNAQAIANGCDIKGTKHPFEDAILKAITDNNLNSKDAAIYVQSFDPASLKYLRSIGLKTKAVQLIDGNSVNYQTGEVNFITNDSDTFVSARPYSWTINGDSRTFAAMLTPSGLAEIKTYADGIGPWKPELMKWTVSPWKAGSTLADVNTLTSTGVIENAHQAGLFVHSFTFRNEAKYLAGVFKGDPIAEYQVYFKAGIDGVFTDFTNTGVAARAAYLKSVGR
ncbi:glycerophosphodiester phosphodiesterase family protein [Aquirhabdus parva]|uniref:glycerophosphodiester phosphodiesterase n=1 Tax=Aquirhabdus parva TaxID=2283318 RepID=A0A345P7X3_9GAMM|nr:glycerophosphodiester phosphodiesterase family protein [Aquirhabdus parva]AXI03382.1 glycerophosphodiester phosphodiesterase [Aquirhabdus parva]